jgi:pimeloyl-ACP methyl ester carboxylesterase
MGDSVPIVAVIGGAGGLAASYDEVRELGSRFGLMADRVRSWARDGASALVDADLLASAPLAPVSFANAESALLDATASGVLDWLAWEGDAFVLHGAIDLLEAADELNRAALDALDYTAMRVLATPFLPVALAVDSVPDPVWDSLVDRLGPLGSGSPGVVDEWVIDHPGAVRHVLNGSGGLVDGLTLGPLPIVEHWSAGSAAAEADTWYDVPGHAAVSAGPVRTTGAAMDLEGLVETLTTVSDRPDGTIAIQTLAGVDGPLHVVYLPGTDALGLPWDYDPAVRDAQTDLAAVAGLPNAYAAGVQQAIAAVGVGDDPVLLVGHSLGGIVAAGLAHDGSLNVAGVITAGSPLAPTPDGISVLSLENRGDVVPMLLGDEPHDTVDHVTVRFDDHEASMVGNHDLAHYVAGAAAVDASDDESLRDQLDGWAPFLAGGPATVQEFTITRAP